MEQDTYNPDLSDIKKLLTDEMKQAFRACFPESINYPSSITIMQHFARLLHRNGATVSDIPYIVVLFGKAYYQNRTNLHKCYHWYKNETPTRREILDLRQQGPAIPVEQPAESGKVYHLPDPQPENIELKKAIRVYFPGVEMRMAYNGVVHNLAKLLVQDNVTVEDIPYMILLYQADLPEESILPFKLLSWYKGAHLTRTVLEILKEEYPGGAPVPPPVSSVPGWMQELEDFFKQDYKCAKALKEDLQKYSLEQVKQIWEPMIIYAATQAEELAKVAEKREQFDNTA